MRYRSVVAAAALAGVAVGGGMVGVFAADGEVVPAEKAAARAAAQVIDPSQITFGASPQEPIDDVGPPAVVESVKAAVPALLTDDVALGRLPREIGTRRSAVVNDREERDRRARELWSAERATQRITELEHGLDLVADDDSYRSFTRNMFVVREWQGVTVTGNTADATLLGHMDYSDETEEITSDFDLQYQVRLVRGGPQNERGWVLDDVVAVDAEETGR